MHSGELTQTINVYANAYTAAADGQRVETASLVCKRRAKIEPAGGTERRVGKQLAADITHLVTVRSDGVTRAITPSRWILWGSRRLNIAQAYEIANGGQWVEMQCVERF